MYDTSWVAATTNAAWMWYFSVYDFINFVTGREPGNEYAGNLFRRLVKPGSEHAEDIRSLWSDVKFPGNKQKPTPAMTIRGLQRLLMMLSNIKNMTSLARSHTRTHTLADAQLRQLDTPCLTCHQLQHRRMLLPPPSPRLRRQRRGLGRIL